MNCLCGIYNIDSAQIGQKPMFYQSTKQKKRVLLFSATLPPYHKANEEA